MKTKYLLCSIMLVALCTACNKVFDELTVNPQQPSMGQYFTTPEAVNEAVMTCYGYIQTQRCFGASASKTTILRSDEASSNSDYGKPGMFGEDLNSSYYTIMQPFGLLYSTASQATYIIENIGGVDFADGALKKAYLGEAYFWRAFVNFYLLMSYRNVSLIEHAPKGMEDYVRPVTAPDVVWDAICSDLQQAKENLPKKGYWKGNNVGRITAGAAAALRGKAYLYRSGIEPLYGTSKQTYYDEAANEFDEVIRGEYGTYSLVNYADNFDVSHENNAESVFEIQFLGDVINNSFNPGLATSGVAFDPRGLMLPGAGAGYEGVVHDWLYNTFVQSIDKNGYTDKRMFTTLFFNDQDPVIRLRSGQRLTGPEGLHFEDLYPEGDFSAVSNTRAAVYKAGILKGMDLSMPMKRDDKGKVSLTGVGGGTKEYIYNQPRAHGVNWRYIRYADVLMMYAEAVVMGGKTGTISATEAFNQVRNRADMMPVGNVSLDDIKKERVLEFALEGHRFFDLLRWGEVGKRFSQLEQTDPNFKQFVADGYYKGFKTGKNEWLPIPITEIETNPYAKQNPGY